MARINLSIPDNIKAEMDALDVNWSEVARAAFDRELQIRKSIRIENMNDVIERLRISKASAEGLDKASGRKAGQLWAQKHASFRHLRRIGNLDLDEGEGRYASQVDVALGNSGNDWGDSFWNDGAYAEPPTEEYVEAFVEGATEVWEQVKDQI
jgi:post-segregation antitoxin (ccd killing protein)